MNNEDRIKRYNEYLNKIPLAEIQENAAIQAERDAKDFQSLKESLAEGKCFYCKNPLTHFSQKKPCFHWLLWKAPGLKKKHFEILFNQKSYHELDAYLRWVANTDVPIRNINDLVEEKSSKKFIETTIRYKNLEWSFSCSYGDLQGHKDKYKGQVPHFHFQMKKDCNVVINYNYFHILFKDYDEFSFAIKRGEIDRLKAGHVHGAGMQTLLENMNPDKLIDSMRGTNSEEDAQFKVDTLLVAEEGTTISGDEIANLFEERKKTGESMAKLVRKLKNVKIKTIIAPGPGVPEIASRNANRGVKKNI